MIGSLAQSLVGVIVDEVAAQGGRRIQQQRDGVAPFQPQQQPYQYQPQQRQQQQLPPGPLASLLESVTLLFNRAVAAVVAGLQYLLLFEALLLSAVVIYGALYWLLMPLRLHDKPIFFDYSNRAKSGGATGTVDFLAQHTQWHPSPLTNVERLNTKVLKAGQHYKVGLELQMPTSYTNRRVGVFMVHTTLLDGQDNELATSARPAMLPHTSALRKGVGMVFSWPLYLLGLRREAETVLVDCVDFYEENALHPLTKARVTVSSGRVQFYRSSIHITPQLKGLPWLMQHWFYSTLTAGVLFIASVELMLFGFCYVFFLSVEGTDKNPGNTAQTNGSGSVGQTVSLAGVNSGGGGTQRPAGVVRSYGAGGAGASSHTERLSTVGTAGGNSSSGSGGLPQTETAGTTAEGRGFVQQDDQGLRRRRTVSAATVAAAEATTTPGTDSNDAGRTTRGASSATESSVTAAAWAAIKPSPAARTQPSPSTLPPGVQAYQRGARYVVQPGGGGGRTAARAYGGGSSGAGTGGGGSGSGSGGGTGTNDPRVANSSTSQEDIDAAALASWAALDDNNGTDPRSRVVARGLRVVESMPVAEECEPLHQPHGVSTTAAATYAGGGGGPGVEEVDRGSVGVGIGDGNATGRDQGGGGREGEVGEGRHGIGSSSGSRDDDNCSPTSRPLGNETKIRQRYGRTSPVRSSWASQDTEIGGGGERRVGERGASVMQAPPVPSAAAAEDGSKGQLQKPKRLTAYLLFQQASRADMYAKFGGKEAFTANLQEKHMCQSTEADQPSFGNGPVVMSAMGKMWSDAPEIVKEFFRHVAQVHNTRADEQFAEEQRQQQQQQQQQQKSKKAKTATTGFVSSNGIGNGSDSEDSDEEDNAPISRLTTPAATATATAAPTAAAGAAAPDKQAQSKASARAPREKQAARKPTPDQARTNPPAPSKVPPQPPAPSAAAPPAKAEAKKRSPPTSTTAAAGSRSGSRSPSAPEAKGGDDDGAAGGGGRKGRANGAVGKNNAAAAPAVAAPAAATAGGAKSAGGAKAKGAGGKRQQAEAAKSNNTKSNNLESNKQQVKGKGKAKEAKANAKAGTKGGKANGGGGGDGGSDVGKKSKAFPGYLESDDVSEESLFGLKRGEKCAIDVLWEVEVQKSGQKAQQSEEWFTSTVDLTEPLGSDAEGRPRFRITYARRGSLAASKSVVVILSSNQVRDDLQDDWEEPMLWRKKGCDVAPGPGIPTPPARPGSAGSTGVDQEAEWADDFGMKSRQRR
eukprot:g9171.t1